MMKAAVYTQYGAPSVLQIKEVTKPTPADNEVLIRIYATTVATVDAIFRSGENISARMFTGVRKPKISIPGGEFAGKIEAVGQNITRYKVGDVVMGTAGTGFSTSAEYICLPENTSMVIKPESLSYEDAVALYPGAMTALPNLREAANIQPGQRVLINGASGSIGTAAVQLAKYLGAHVTGVCSTRNVELVKSLGADEVIDYTKQDFTQARESYDVIFDTVGKSSFPRCKSALKPGGLYLSTSITVNLMWNTFWTGKFGDKQAKIIFAGLRSEAEKLQDLEFCLDLYQSGALKPVVDRTYPLERIADAHGYVDSGHKRGQVVITVG